MKILCSIEARMGSKRLPGKVLRPICHRPMLEQVIRNTQDSELIDEIVVATTYESEDAILLDWAESCGCLGRRGSTHDILSRLSSMITEFRPDYLVSLTSDNPFIDGSFIDSVIAMTLEGKYQYAATTHMHHSDLWNARRQFPIGISVQVVDADLLLVEESKVEDPKVRAAGLFSIYDNPNVDRKLAVPLFGDFIGLEKVSDLRMTVDTPADLHLANLVFEEFRKRGKKFTTFEAVKLLLDKPEIALLNSFVVQKIGLEVDPK